jgi:hypothetical protein
LSLAILLLGGCAGSKPAPEEPVEQPADDPAPEPIHVTPGPDDPAPEGRKIWEEIPNAPHGQCCESDDECGPITCEPYEYAISNCTHVCTFSCDPGDLCPKMGGTFGPPIPCPENGLCPVGPPWV